MFATGDSRCPDALFKSYLAKRPEDLKLSGPFYLACIGNPTKTDVWYKKSRMGKNAISRIMATMKENSPLQEMCPDKRLSNHSVRKTVVKRLKASGVPKSEIIVITGHRQEQSVDMTPGTKKNSVNYLTSLMAKNPSSTRQPAEFLLSRLFSQVQRLAVAMYIISAIVMWW